MSSQNFATRAIHAGQSPSKWTHRAVIPPISLSTTFQQSAPDKYPAFEYSRSGNPTRQCLEESIAALEYANYALCFSSGMSTVLTITNLLKSGDHVICGDDLYGGINRFFSKCAVNMNIQTTFVDLREIANLKNAITSNTKMVWLETPTNPTMKIIDIEGISKVLKDYPGIFSVVDNTFMSPYFQNPLKLGADIVMHSLTKYINGHSDVVMGALATNNEDLYNKLYFLQYATGTVPSPFDCFLVNRGIKTLHIRMQRHQENALALAKFLDHHPQVEKVLYPGLESHPQYKLAKKQCSGFSGMVSFYIKGGVTEAEKFVASLKLITLAESLGSVETLVEIPSLMTHASVAPEQRMALSITDNLIRLSVGLESVADLMEDIDQAFAKVIAKA